MAFCSALTTSSMTVALDWAFQFTPSPHQQLYRQAGLDYRASDRGYLTPPARPGSSLRATLLLHYMDQAVAAFGQGPEFKKQSKVTGTCQNKRPTHFRGVPCLGRPVRPSLEADAYRKHACDRGKTKHEHRASKSQTTRGR